MLKEKILEDLNSALKRKKETEVSVLRLLLTSVLNREKEKRYKLSKEKSELAVKELEKKSSLSDEEVLGVVLSEIKKRKEAILIFEKGKRKDLMEKENAEIEVLKKYLPEQLSEEEIKKLAAEAVEKIGAKQLKDMGKVMAELVPKIKGRADGNSVSKIVKKLLEE